MNTQEEGSAELDDAELALEAGAQNQQPYNINRDLKRVLHDCVTEE